MQMFIYNNEEEETVNKKIKFALLCMIVLLAISGCTKKYVLNSNVEIKEDVPKATIISKTPKATSEALILQDKCSNWVETELYINIIEYPEPETNETGVALTYPGTWVIKRYDTEEFDPNQETLPEVSIAFYLTENMVMRNHW